LPVGAVCGPPTEQYERGTCGWGSSEQGGEVGVGRHEDTALGTSQREDLAVCRRLKAEVPDVRGVMARTAQTVRKPGRKRVVDEESQDAARNGRSRCRTLSAA